MSDSESVISIENGEFCWEPQPQIESIKSNRHTTLSKNYEALSEGINSHFLSSSSLDRATENLFKIRIAKLSVIKSEMVMIIGPTNSGKSSLLYSILGEMVNLQNNTYTISGNMCLMDQHRFLIGGSISDNITFGKPLSIKKINKAIYNAALEQDLATMEDGLDTILGDTNDTVSGGQRTRINLARCFYQK